MVYFVDESDPEERTPEMLNAHAVRMRDAFHDDRRIVAVVKGTIEFARKARRVLDPQVFEAVVITGPLPHLQTLDVKVLDCDWQQGARQLSMDEVMNEPDEEAERA